MSLVLRPLSSEQFPVWLNRSIAEYEADLVVAGMSAEAAQSQAEHSIRSAFTSSGPTATNAVFDVVTPAAQAVGYVWVGRDQSADPASWWVWDIVIDPEFRGKGYGKAAMGLAEGYARSQGARRLGLSVFGFNATARSLYESLGYETTAVKMSKQLAAND